VAICACIFGAAWGLTYYADPGRRAELPEETAAARVFGRALGFAIVGGAFWYALAGTWYGVRLSLCKPHGMSWKLARRTFIFSELVYALPCAIGMSIWWITQGPSFLIAILIVSGVLMFWSVYVSYRGVRALFQADRVRAMVLFIVLPSIFYAACWAVPMLLENARSHLTKATVPFEDSVFTMNRPANWVPLKAPGPGAIEFHIPDVGGFVATVRDTQAGTVDLEQTARAMAQKMATNFKTVARDLERFSAWGAYSGHGFRLTMNVDGNETVARVFCGSLPGRRVLIINEIGLVRAESELDKEFEIVRKTLRVKPIR